MANLLASISFSTTLFTRNGGTSALRLNHVVFTLMSPLTPEEHIWLLQLINAPLSAPAGRYSKVSELFILFQSSLLVLLEMILVTVVRVNRNKELSWKMLKCSSELRGTAEGYRDRSCLIWYGTWPRTRIRSHLIHWLYKTVDFGSFKYQLKGVHRLSTVIYWLRSKWNLIKTGQATYFHNSR